MNKKTLVIFLLLFIKVLAFSYEVKKNALDIQKIELNEIKKFTVSENLSLVKSLRNNDIVISIASDKRYYNYYLYSPEKSNELTFLFDGYDDKFYIIDNKILSLNEEGFIYSFDPYKKTLDIKEKPQKLFFHMKMEMTSVGENISFQVMIKPYLLIDTKTIFPLNIYFII